jgi:Phosphotransferase enzyme family
MAGWAGENTVTEEELLRGGVANAGAVRRVGDDVLRRANAHSVTIHALLRHVRRAGFDGVPEPLGLDPGGERLRFIAGEVPYPPFASWAQTDDVLASTASLLRRFHDATVGFVAPENGTWSAEMTDAPSGEGNGGERNGGERNGGERNSGERNSGGGNDDEVICHNDVCPENVVYRAGRAVALLDFDFAAPGSRVYDLARLALMQVPIDAPRTPPARAGAGSTPSSGSGWWPTATG